MENPKGPSHKTWSVTWRAPSDFVLFKTTRGLHRVEAMRTHMWTAHLVTRKLS
jgi:hypothetical protein